MEIKKLFRPSLTAFVIVISPIAMGWAQPICPINPPISTPQGVKSLKFFKRLAVQDQGRIKPLDTYARNLLLQFSGRGTYARRPAVYWLAQFLFAPESTQQDKIFCINNPEILEALGIPVDPQRLYSFAELEPGYPKLFELAQAANTLEKKTRGIVEEEIIRLEANLRVYADLSRVFKFAVPHAEFTVTDPATAQILELPSDGHALSFIDIALRADRIHATMERLERIPQHAWTQTEKEIVRITNNLFHWSFLYTQLPFAILPPLETETEDWLNPWDSLHRHFQSGVTRAELTALRNMLVAYWNGQQLEFDMAAKSFQESVQQRVRGKAKRSTHLIPLELFYNQLNPFFWIKIFYGLAFLLALIINPAGGRVRYRISFGLLLTAFALHGSALFIRIVLMARPPVTNLYETFIFVGFMSSLAGLLIELRKKNSLGLLVASLCGFVFTLISGKFAAEGDTLRMLVAVLNSNFWLGTHVLSITTGYAGVCVAGVIGHIYLLQVLQGREKKILDSTYGTLLGALGFGLTVTFLGTNLGGIWADQSWGRFWGWDPKENGALLIILWTAIIFHAKIAKLIGPLGVAAMSALGIVVVMWAWFGVNLLSVGLHSYGFTSGVAWGLGIYVLAQMTFLLIALPLARKRLSG